MGNDRVRVAAAAGLHLTDLAHGGEVRDVEDAKTAEAFLAHISGNALKPAIDAPTRLLDAHDEDIAHNRDIALPAGAHNRTHQRRDTIIAQLVNVEAVIAACDHDIVEEGHIGVGKVEQRGAFGELGEAFLLVADRRLSALCVSHGFSGFLSCLFSFRFFLFRLIFRHCRAKISRVVRIEEARRLGQADNLAQVHDRLARIGKARQKLEELVAMATHAGVKASSDLSFNEEYIDLVKHLKARHFNLVVIGSHGARGIREALIGSNTQKIVRLSPVPVLVVKEAMSEMAIQNVVFASHFEDDMIEPFQRAHDFARALGAKVHLLYVNTPGIFETTRETTDRIRGFVEMAEAEADSINIYNHRNETKGILEFCDDQQADLIAITTYGRKNLLRMIYGNISEHLINHAQKPVLTLNIGVRT